MKLKSLWSVRTHVLFGSLIDLIKDAAVNEKTLNIVRGIVAYSLLISLLLSLLKAHYEADDHQGAKETYRNDHKVEPWPPKGRDQ